MGDPGQESLRLVGDANISVDVDSLDCYRAIHGLPLPKQSGPDPVWSKGVVRARELFLEFDLKGTFFLVGRDLLDSRVGELAVELVEQGHEAANHTFDHFYNLRRRGSAEIFYQLQACDQIIEMVTGQRSVGLRVPGYNLSASILSASQEMGHRYDASLFPCPSYWTAKAAVMAVRGLLRQPSRSDFTDLRTLSGPKEPYFPARERPWSKGVELGEYVEFPISVLAKGMIPVIGTSLHLLDLVGWERLWPMIHGQFPHFFSLEFHGLDFIDGQDLEGEPDQRELLRRQPDLRISVKEKLARYRRVLASMAADREVVTYREAWTG